MARKSTKQPGALVKLFRRKRPGLGIIMDTKKTHDIYDQAKAAYKSEMRELSGSYDLKFARALKLVSYQQIWQGSVSYVPEPEADRCDHDMFRAAAFYASCEPYSENLKNRTLVKVRWFKKPSDWERTSIDKESDWYPADCLRTVSPVKKNRS